MRRGNLGVGDVDAMNASRAGCAAPGLHVGRLVRPCMCLTGFILLHAAPSCPCTPSPGAPSQGASLHTRDSLRGALLQQLSVGAPQGDFLSAGVGTQFDSPRLLILARQSPIRQTPVSTLVTNVCDGYGTNYQFNFIMPHRLCAASAIVACHAVTHRQVRQHDCHHGLPRCPVPLTCTLFQSGV